MNKLQALNRSPIVAAAFLMATSAIGPGFLTQTAVFTNQLLASFGFIILVSILLDIGAQLNIWRILSVSGMRAQEVANKVIPGAGYILTLLIVTGGLAFNIGNLAGAGLGLNVLTGLSPETGAAISALIAIGIFVLKDALKWMDGFTKLLGIVMLGLTLYVVFASRPPIAEAVQKTFWPDKIDIRAILTLVGGTVGGYISFAGAHRLLDSGLTGESALYKVNQSAVSAILLASLMRVLLFLAALGVVSRGIPLTENNPAASVFQIAAGQIGYKIFGIVMWSAAITSVIGSAYTSISFLKTFHPSLIHRQKPMIIVFIVISAIFFILNGQPVKTLVFVGALNGFILPFSLGIILMAAYRRQIVQAYRHPAWLTVFGGLVVAATLWMSVRTAYTFFAGN
jgi:Mn2+/Fe2+ NRAMP family transporter